MEFIIMADGISYSMSVAQNRLELPRIDISLIVPELLVGFCLFAVSCKAYKFFYW